MRDIDVAGFKNLRGHADTWGVKLSFGYHIKGWDFRYSLFSKLGIEPFNTVRRPKTRLHPTGHTAQPRFHEPLCRSEILTRQHRQ